MGKKLTGKVTWVGKTDWELKKFHGNEYSVNRGSSYNSYLVRDKKTALIDTVWKPFDKEFVSRLKQDKNNIVTEVFRSKGVLVGSPTLNNGYLYSIGGLLEMMKGLKFKGKSAAAFGSYGWSGETVKQLTGKLAECGFNVVNDGIRSLWVPDESALAACADFGRQLAAQM